MSQSSRRWYGAHWPRHGAQVAGLALEGVLAPFRVLVGIIVEGALDHDLDAPAAVERRRRTPSIHQLKLAFMSCRRDLEFLIGHQLSARSSTDAAATMTDHQGGVVGGIRGRAGIAGMNDAVSR